MAQTEAQVRARLPDVLANIVLNYFRASGRAPHDIAMAGEYEETLELGYSYDAVIGACAGKHTELCTILLMIGCAMNDNGLVANFEDDMDGLLVDACMGDYPDIVHVMLDLGVMDTNSCLRQGCIYNSAIARLAIARGADDWQRGLNYACWGGDREMVALMVANGATTCECGVDHSVDPRPDGPHQ